MSPEVLREDLLVFLRQWEGGRETGIERGGEGGEGAGRERVRMMRET